MRILLAVGLALVLASPAFAQDIGLPDWAAPSAPAPSTASMDAPPLPPTPQPAQVPIDGGLGLLALAGGAYAARRLRKPDPEA